MAVTQVAYRGYRAIGKSKMEQRDVLHPRCLHLNVREGRAHEKAREIDEVHRLADNSAPAFIGSPGPVIARKGPSVDENVHGERAGPPTQRVARPDRHGRVTTIETDT